MQTFAEILSARMQAIHMPRRRLARLAHCDESYVTRILSGERKAPSREIVDSFCDVLYMEPYDRNRLLVAAGISPTDEWNETMEIVMNLSNGSVLNGQTEEYVKLVETISRVFVRGAQ